MDFDTSILQEFKLLIEDVLPFSVGRTVLHFVSGGLGCAIGLIVGLIVRSLRFFSSWLFFIITLALFVEIGDLIDDIRTLRYGRYGDSIGDFFATATFPLLALLLRAWVLWRRDKRNSFPDKPR